MSKTVCHYVWNDFLGDRMYAVDDPALNQDERLRSLYLLREHLKGLGIDLHTQDILPPEAADLILLENCPHGDALATAQAFRTLGKPLLLNASESITVLPPNNDPEVLGCFDRVFTYQDRLLGDDRYRKFNYTFDLPRQVGSSGSAFSEKKLLCAVSANKRASGQPNELYSERTKLYRWYEKHAREHFDLYGIGWERPHKMAAPLYRRKLLHKWPLRAIFARPFKCWQGAIDSKYDVLGDYRFALCFENTAGPDGYITEKIFDAMLCGCVPVYWGAPNVTDHIPAACFVDYRKFGSPRALHEFLLRVSEDQHAEYLAATEAFFQSPQSDPFRFPFFVNTVSEEICARLSVPYQPFSLPA